MENMTGGVIGIALGVAVLLLGKNLRLFAAAAGFLVGVSVMQALFPAGSLLVAAIVGAILALGAVILLVVGKGFVQLILRIIGALAGGAIGLWLMQSLGSAGLLNWLVAVVAAVIGFFLMARFFDVGIIILTSLIGASLIVGGVESFFPLSDGVSTLAMIGLAVIGFFFQRRR